MLEGMLVLWTVLTVLSFAFVSYDVITNTPEANIMKAGWVLVVLYTGPVGLFFYFLTCREPLPGTHEQFVNKLWKQSVGSEVHCLAGDATGIILTAIILSFYNIARGWEITLEYVGGFICGLLIFQALFMRKMMGGSYIKALKNTFYPEWLSMNMIMAGMIPVMGIWAAHDTWAHTPKSLHFWGMMSFATLVGGFVAYPMNYWLVKKGLKHGMMTVRDGVMVEQEHMHHPETTQREIYRALFVSLIALVVGIIIAVIGAYL